MHSRASCYDRGTIRGGEWNRGMKGEETERGKKEIKEGEKAKARVCEREKRETGG